MSVAVNALASMVEHMPRTWQQLAEAAPHTASEAVWAWVQLAALLAPGRPDSPSTSSGTSALRPGQLRVLQPRKTWWHDAFFAQAMPTRRAASDASASGAAHDHPDSQSGAAALTHDFIVAQAVVCGCLFGDTDPFCETVDKWVAGQHGTSASSAL